MSPMCQGRGCSCKTTEWGHIAGESDRDLFARGVHERFYEPGTTIFMQGDDCSGVYCIRSGLVGLRRSDDHGNSAMLRLSQHGDILGYRALIGKRPHRNTAEVLTPSRVCVIGASRLDSLLQRNQCLVEAFLQRALADLTRAEANCAEQMTGSLKVRFLHLLFRLYRNLEAQRGDREDAFDLPVQRKDLAALLGVAPESISRVISQLEEQGLVRFAGRRVIFSNKEHCRATIQIGIEAAAAADEAVLS
jgi:CRP-like cAMP-binding protein